MDSYENIIDQAHKAGMDVVEHSFRNDTIKGLYCDGTAAINKNIETTVEKACVAAEELGHQSVRCWQSKTRVSCPDACLQ